MFAEIYENAFERHLVAPEATLLYMLWQMARGQRDFPEEHEIAPHRIDYLRNDLMILRTAGQNDWRYLHYGSSIAAQAGFDMTGKCVSDFKGPTREFYLHVYQRVHRERRPLATAHRLGVFGERPLWERLILPVGPKTGVETMFVLNKVRETEKDISHIFARARGRAMLILQFRRDADRSIVDAEIIGANTEMRLLSHRRYDQLVGHSALTIFPSLHTLGLWSQCQTVAAMREPIETIIDYHMDGIDGRFKVFISPHLDGLTIDFERAEFRGKSEASGVTSSRPAA
ncbi:Protein of unknown function DUF1457 [Rhabdaerophilaceae bacterium]